MNRFRKAHAFSGVLSSVLIGVAALPLSAFAQATDAPPSAAEGQQANNDQEDTGAVYVDDVYMGAPSSTVMGLNNIERIEVLKGPLGRRLCSPKGQPL